jgi:SanA protein
MLLAAIAVLAIKGGAMSASFFNARRLVRWVVMLGLGGVLAVAGINVWILRSSKTSIFMRPEETPENDVALVLGTSRVAGDGLSSNPFFYGRLDAAAKLYQAGKTKHFLLSGDNGHAGYDEPTWMRDGLLKRGVPAAAITLDYAGFRTFDSVVRAKTVFGLKRFTIVTDDFHLPRAVFLAQSQGLEVVGCRSESVPWKWSKKTRLREIGSRVKAWIDVSVLGTKPKFEGPPVEIRIGAAH